MKSTTTVFILLFLAASMISCSNRSDKTEIAFTETIDVFQVSSPSLPARYSGIPITGFVVGYSLDNTAPIQRYIGEFPRATLEGAGEEFGSCNDGRKHLIALDPSPDRPLRMTAKVIGDTGAEDVSHDRNCNCDSRIDEIAVEGFAVYFQGMSEPLQFDGFKLSGEELCPNIEDGHLVRGDREFGGAVDIMGAVILRVAPDNSTILADISLSMIESDRS